MNKTRVNFISFLLVIILSLATACNVSNPSSQSESDSDSDVMSEIMSEILSEEESVSESESIEESESVYVVEGDVQHVYKVFTETVTWYEAEAFCKKYGGHLATITSEKEQEAIASIILATGTLYWLGGSDFIEEGKWEWVTDEDWSYETWVPNAPEGGTAQNHLLLGSNTDAYKWRDGTHSERYGYICEWEEDLTVVAEDEIVFNDHRYKIIGSPTTWLEAKEYCEKRGGHLVTVTSVKEQAVVEQLASGKSLWLGATDEEEEGVWKWVTGEEWNYTNWSSGEPTNSQGKEHYLHINLSVNTWNDLNADVTLNYFICEWEPENLEESGLVSGIYIEGNTQHVYKVFNNLSLTYYEAKAYCERLGGHLATITSAEEEAIIDSLTSKKVSYWLGASDYLEEGKWEWVTGEDWSYTNWSGNEPNNAGGEEHYLGYWRDNDTKTWNDCSQRQTFCFVCEWEVECEVLTKDEIVFNGHRYRIIGIPTTWSQASEYCERLGGHLATVTSAEEEGIIEQLCMYAEKTGTWLGGTDCEVEGDWKWVTGEEWAYENWRAGQPNNAQEREHYLGIYYQSNVWDDFNSTVILNYFICEWDTLE